MQKGIRQISDSHVPWSQIGLLYIIVYTIYYILYCMYHVPCTMYYVLYYRLFMYYVLDTIYYIPILENGFIYRSCLDSMTGAPFSPSEHGTHWLRDVCLDILGPVLEKNREEKVSQQT
jgi:hypothetical protein